MDLRKSLEFHKVINDIKDNCKTTGAKTLAENITFSNNFEQISKLLRQSYQMKSILMGIKRFPDSGYIDMREILSKLKIEGSCIALENMPKLLDSLLCIKDILQFIDEQDEKKIPDIKIITKDIVFDNEIYNSCNAIIDEQGDIRLSYSPILREIYSKREIKRRQIERQINQIIINNKKNGWTNEDHEISIRNDTFVIPVKATYKRNVKGILHDTSQTGQTFYIEPEEIVSLNFEIKELFFEEQKEIHRILLEFSDFLRPRLESLLYCYEILVQIDFIKAKAFYAIETNSSMPQINPLPQISWYDARHPILEKILKQKEREIVPLRIELNTKQRILVISGPNAGGKSICLKTVALLQYMLQCGILVPMKEISISGIFERIFISIGDEQSLSDDLSTYSSHLKNLSEICNNSDENTLFLIDELGTGTDPSVGGAIAESILEYLNSTKSFGVITTHYSVLKHLAFDHEGISNAAMLFDTVAMQPLYKLTIGTPGSSFAFEIAMKTGLSKLIINNAKNKLGKQSIKFEENLQQIEVNKLESEKHLRSAKQYDDVLYQTVKKYKEMLLKLESDRHNILNSARNQAKEILLSANKQIEHTIEEIKTSKAEKGTVKQQKEKIKQSLEDIDNAINQDNIQLETDLRNQFKENDNILSEQTQQKKQKIKIVTTPIEINDYIIFSQTKNIGIVVGINKNHLQIDVGNMRVQTTRKNICKIDKSFYIKQQCDNERQNKKNTNDVQIKTSFDLNHIRTNFNEKLDIRGYRGDEAIVELGKFLDQARILGQKYLRVLHGKGNGILKILVREYLRKQSDIVSYYAEDIRFGGEGITVIEMR